MWNLPQHCSSYCAAKPFMKSEIVPNIWSKMLLLSHKLQANKMSTVIGKPWAATCMHHQLIIILQMSKSMIHCDGIVTVKRRSFNSNKFKKKIFFWLFPIISKPNIVYLQTFSEALLILNNMDLDSSTDLKKKVIWLFTSSRLYLI